MEDAVGMVVDRLSRGCGRVFVGTPAELADYEDAHMPHVNP
jgi:hypothetical protein